jgi:hypothetical protein
MLADGSWCGHGEPVWHVFDVRDGDKELFAVQRPAKLADDDLRPTAVRLVPIDGRPSFLVYDSRKHPASLFASKRYSNIEPEFAKEMECEQCRGKHFRVSAGYEIPSDSSSPNDTSWFALAAVCAGCGAEGIVFDDETA